MKSVKNNLVYLKNVVIAFTISVSTASYKYRWTLHLSQHIRKKGKST